MSAARLVGVLHVPPLPGAANRDRQSMPAMGEASAQHTGTLANTRFTAAMTQNTHAGSCA